MVVVAATVLALLDVEVGRGYFSEELGGFDVELDGGGAADELVLLDVDVEVRGGGTAAELVVFDTTVDVGGGGMTEEIVFMDADVEAGCVGFTEELVLKEMDVDARGVGVNFVDTLDCWVLELVGLLSSEIVGTMVGPPGFPNIKPGNVNVIELPEESVKVINSPPPPPPPSPKLIVGSGPNERTWKRQSPSVASNAAVVKTNRVLIVEVLFEERSGKRDAARQRAYRAISWNGTGRLHGVIKSHSRGRCSSAKLLLPTLR